MIFDKSLGTLHIKNNNARKLLYKLNLYFVTVGSLTAIDVLRSHGVHVLSERKSFFVPNVWREGDFQGRYFRYFGSCGGELTVRSDALDAVADVIDRELGLAYTADKPWLKGFMVKRFQDDMRK